MAYCVRCGQQLGDGMNFCPVCGTAVTAAGTQQELLKKSALYKQMWESHMSVKEGA